YVTDISNFFGEVQPARDEHFSGPVYPAMSGVQVAALADPSWLVEVDGTAVID
ncbi:MAG: RidA family protein, partial [Actinobacteria bacterium]|nr:RidA family protein [Actinomycetota bacterium]NIU18393.1 RidA family protein [Actinomycetota bacterium]NIU65162.1 RidA family protein [Actinomycetota bacterium]NIV86209.1 RidA family protein [Actinomycetota bacterium]NIW26971.1 RidA family protein [Actinomycetota bacterium]